MAIHFTQIDRRGLRTGRNLAKKWLTSVIKAEKHHMGEIIIAFCSDSYIKEANKKFLQHDYATDIITFDQSTDEERQNKLISADLLISVDQTKENAKRYGSSATEELYRVMVHGLLHLMGYDDTTEELQQKMRAREDYHLKRRKLIV